MLAACFGIRAPPAEVGDIFLPRYKPILAPMVVYCHMLFLKIRRANTLLY